MGTYVSYMSRPFFIGEKEAIDTTEKEIREYLNDNGYTKDIPIFKIEHFGHLVLIFIDKELSMAPLALYGGLECTHTKFAWTMVESLDGKGEGGFL